VKVADWLADEWYEDVIDVPDEARSSYHTPGSGGVAVVRVSMTAMPPAVPPPPAVLEKPPETPKDPTTDEKMLETLESINVRFQQLLESVASWSSTTLDRLSAVSDEKKMDAKFDKDPLQEMICHIDSLSKPVPGLPQKRCVRSVMEEDDFVGHQDSIPVAASKSMRAQPMAPSVPISVPST